MPTFLNDECHTVLPTTFLNDASPSDEEEEEQRLFTQPEAEAEAIDLTVESNPPKQQGKTPNMKKSDPPKRKATTPGKTPNKKKQHCDISDADLDAQLKQVAPKMSLILFFMPMILFFMLIPRTTRPRE